MQEEKISLTPTEAGADKTPQRLLKDILDKEVAGSAVIHAYGDYAASEDVRAYLEWKKAANNGELVLDADTAESLADQAAIKETMRQRRLGENASVYMKNLGLARVFF
jgi:hypothetical protein